MISVKHYDGNPILKPNPQNEWEADAAFNGCVIKDKDNYKMLYRAQGKPQDYFGGAHLSLSTIGICESTDGYTFSNRRQLLIPEYDFEKFGLEDPRITQFEDTYYIFYTGLSQFPFNADGIKVAVAVSKDLQTFEKHPVTPFNAKAMALFPQRVNGKIAALLTVNTDHPPAKICLALFDTVNEIWSNEYWDEWYKNLDAHIIDLQRGEKDHIELGAPPLKTETGWLVIYSYIKNYLTDYKQFGIESVFLSESDPQTILGRTNTALLVPEKTYELEGMVPNVIFPSGALLHGDELLIYYGAADTSVAAAKLSLSDLVDETISHQNITAKLIPSSGFKLTRFEKNPILIPLPYHPWEFRATFNAAALEGNGTTHILYRAMGHDDTSVIGYASSRDGMNIDERLPEPVYLPREEFETKARPGNSGCEDARLSKINDRIYMTYTAYNGIDPTRVALTSLSQSDFYDKKWNWETPILISPPGINDKNACIFPEKINNAYVFFHRIDPCIWIDYVKDITFRGNHWLSGEILLEPRSDKWDSEKVGISGPPIKTDKGWLLIYHGVSKKDRMYRLGALLLHPQHPNHILSRLDEPILEPMEDYEMKGVRSGTVFSNGIVLKDKTLFVYYGGADQVLAVATCELDAILRELTK